METTTTAQPAVTNGNNVNLEGGKFLTFFLGNEEYALEILKVQEIIGMMAITPVPNMPHYIRGVLNLRGKIIPVMELRLRFGLNPVPDTEETCIVVVQSGNYLMGVVVDKVSEVAEIDQKQMEQVPTFGSANTNEYLAGIGKFENSVKLLLDIEKVLFDVPDNVLLEI
jgi:purine-binding chemotaxis protein CheW